MKQSYIDESSHQFIEYEDLYRTEIRNIRVKDLGEKFAAINAFFFEYLREYHIPTAFTNLYSGNKLIFLKNTKFPFSVNILNTVDKRTSKIFNIKVGTRLTLPVYEYHYGEGKNSLITESHLLAFDLCSVEELRIINRLCSKINAVLRSYFERRDFILSEFYCLFGKNDNKVLVINDFTPRSLKILPGTETNKAIDPYKLSTAPQVKKYTDMIFNLINT